MLVIPRAQSRAILEALVDTGALLDDVLVRLFTNNIEPTPASVLADFTQATFTGYAASAAVSWDAVFTDLLGNAVVRGDTETFVATGTPTPETIYGYYLTKSGGGGALVGSQRFTTPVNITLGGDGLTVVPEMVIPAQMTL